jgi:hypothetical protein
LQQARRGAFLVRERLAPLRRLIDAAILVCGVLAIEGDWIERIFAPVVLLAALYGGPLAAASKWESLRDRGLVAAVIAAGAFAFSTQVGVMVAAVAMLALNIGQSRKGGG